MVHGPFWGHLALHSSCPSHSLTSNQRALSILVHLSGALVWMGRAQAHVLPPWQIMCSRLTSGSAGEMWGKELTSLSLGFCMHAQVPEDAAGDCPGGLLI